MEWPRRRSRFAIVALLVTMLASTRDATAARRVGVFGVDVSASRSAGRPSVSMAAREAAYLMMTALHAGDGLSGEDVVLSRLRECPHATGAGRAEVIGSSRRNSSEEYSVNRKLMIAVPKKHGFQIFVKFAIAIFEAAMLKIEHPPHYELCAFNGPYDDLVGNVSSGVFDAAVGDVTITEERSKIVDFTMPYAASSVSLLSYTANLSSMLTAKKLRPQVTDLHQLKRSNDSIGYQHGTFVGSVLRNEGFPQDRLKPYDQEEYAEALRNGTVSAIADETPYLHYFLSDSRQQSKDLEMVDRHLYTTPGFGFVFPRGCPLVHNLSVAILSLTAGNEGLRIEHEWLGKATPSTADGSPIADSTALTLRSFSGLFVITGCVSTLMLLIRISRFVYAKYARVTRVRGSGLQGADEHGGNTRLGNLVRRRMAWVMALHLIKATVKSGVTIPWVPMGAVEVLIMKRLVRFRMVCKMAVSLHFLSRLRCVVLTKVNTDDSSTVTNLPWHLWHTITQTVD
ncbi:hypothetical protein EJB05_45890, partial [Eragrostis curvula]